jgi:hypothetical protein
MIIRIMDNFSEVLGVEEPVRLEKERNGGWRAEESTPKGERGLFQELPIFAHVKYTEIYKSPEGKGLEKQRLRQQIFSRAETHAPEKSLAGKKLSEPKDLDRVNFSKVPFLPLLSIRTNAIEELYKEIKEMKNSISELEERNKVTSQCIDTGKVKIQDLEERYRMLRNKAGIGCSAEERKEELNFRIKTLVQGWKQNCCKLRQRIAELEEEGKELGVKTDTLKNLIFRKGKQQRVLKKKQNDSGSNSENGYHSCDLLNSSAQVRSVAHSPSWNVLYGV